MKATPIWSFSLITLGEVVVPETLTDIRVWRFPVKLIFQTEYERSTPCSMPLWLIGDELISASLSGVDTKMWDDDGEPILVQPAQVLLPPTWIHQEGL